MLNKIKIVFMGTPEFAVAPLKALLDDTRFNVTMVVTQPDAPVGRKQLLTPPPVKELAIKYNIKVQQPETLRKNEDFLAILKSESPDFLVTAAYGKILPQTILDVPKFLPINIHGSILPKYRGASPIEEALLNGDKETGITYIKMGKGMDDGQVLQINKLPIIESDNNQILREKLSKLAAETVCDLLINIVENKITMVEQEHEKATYCGKIIKENGEIKPEIENAEKILNKIRAYTPWPSTFIIRNQKRYKLIDAIQVIKDVTKANVGDFFEYEKKLFLQTFDGQIEVLRIQPEGKNAISAQDFLRGNSLNLLNTQKPKP